MRTAEVSDVLEVAALEPFPEPHKAKTDLHLIVMTKALC